jgi:hypothetical protein
MAHLYELKGQYYMALKHYLMSTFSLQNRSGSRWGYFLHNVADTMGKVPLKPSKSADDGFLDVAETHILLRGYLQGLYRTTAEV